jgi:hypothetical protein
LPERLRSDRVLLHESASSPSASGHTGFSRRSAASSSTKDHERGSWYNHPVYAVQKAYVGQLLVELLGADTRTEYLVDVLVAPLCPDAFIYQRDVRKMSLAEMTNGWAPPATAIASVADARR